MGASTVQANENAVIHRDPLRAFLITFKALVVGSVTPLDLWVVGRAHIWLQRRMYLQSIHLERLPVKRWLIRSLRLIHLVLLSRVTLALRRLFLLCRLLLLNLRIFHNLVLHTLGLVVLQQWVRGMLPLAHWRSWDAHLVYLINRKSLWKVILDILLGSDIVRIGLYTSSRHQHRLRITLMKAQWGSCGVGILKDVAWVGVQLWGFVGQIQNLIRGHHGLRLVTVGLNRLPNSPLLILKVPVSLVLLRLFGLILQKEFRPTWLIVDITIDIILVTTLAIWLILAVPILTKRILVFIIKVHSF